MSGAEVAHRLARRLRTLSSRTSRRMRHRRADLQARDLRFLPPFIAPAPECTDRRGRAHPGRPLQLLRSRGLRSRRSAAMEPRPAHAALGRHPSRLGHRLSRRARGRQHQVPVGAEPASAPAAAGAGAGTHRRHALRLRDPAADRFLDRAMPGGPRAQLGQPAGTRHPPDQLEPHVAALGGFRSRLFATREGEEFRDRWLRSIYQQARMVATNLSRFSSANNHLIGEAAGVYVAASTWPLWPQMGEWGERCRKVLEDECLRQNAPDGGNREQAFAYQTFVLDFLLLAGLAARARGEDFSPVYWRRIELMVDFLASMTDVAGRMPMVGDADDGLVVKLAAEPGFLRSWLADRHGRGAVQPRGSRRQGGLARRQDRDAAGRRGRAPARAAQGPRPASLPSDGSSIPRVRLLSTGRGLRHAR